MNNNDKEKTIIEAALKIFSKKGYTNARMADIAEEAAMSYGSLYHYYKSKDALFDIIVDDWWTGLFTELEKIQTSAAATKDKLESIVIYLLDMYATNPNLVEIYITEVSRGFIYHFESRGKENFLKLFSLCEEIISEGQKRGDLRTDISARYLMNIFLGSIDSFLSTMVFGKMNLRAAQKEKMIKSILGVFFHGSMIWY